MNRTARHRRRSFGLGSLRDPIEAAFGRYGHWIHRRAWRVIVAMACGVAALATQIPNLVIDTSTEGLLPPSHRVRVDYDGFRDRYGRDQAILLAIETDDVFDFEFLERLRDMHDEIESDVPGLQDVQSLINTRNTRGEGDELIVEDLLEKWPESEAELALVRERVRANPLYVDQLISRDGRITTLLIKPNVYSSLDDEIDGESGEFSGFDDEMETSGEKPPYLTGEENTAIIRAVGEIVARYDREDFRIQIAGMPVMVDRIMNAMMKDMGRFTAMSLVAIALCLGLLFRRASAVILPLTVSVLAMLTTISLMALIGIPITTTSQIMPSFLLAVGVGGAVHILVIFYQALARGEEKEGAIAYALQHSGLAVTMTSFTTAGGMISFVSADLTPIMELGIITPIGIMMALLFSIVLLPALISVFPTKLSESVTSDHVSPTRAILIRCGDLATTHAWAVLGGCALLLVVSIVGATRLELSHDPISWFPEDDPMRIAMMTMDERMGGSMFVELVIDTGTEDSIQSPRTLEKMEKIRNFAMAQESENLKVGKVVSILDVVKETHQALNENRPEFYAIPQDPQLIAQELLLFENSGSDDLEELVDTQFSEARMTLKMPFSDAVQYSPLLDRIQNRSQEIFADEAEVAMTGEGILMTTVVQMLSTTLIKTYMLAFAIITPLMILLLGNLPLGLVSMIPNLMPLIVTLGIMGWIGIPLEIFTLLIGSIALGLAVDDTIHFMHNFRRYYEQSGDVHLAVRETLSTTGQALLFTSIVLSCGFFIYMFATMSNLFYFGLLTGITIILAFLADLILAPALMSLLAKRIAGENLPAPDADHA